MKRAISKLFILSKHSHKALTNSIHCSIVNPNQFAPKYYNECLFRNLHAHTTATDYFAKTSHHHITAISNPVKLESISNSVINRQLEGHCLWRNLAQINLPKRRCQQYSNILVRNSQSYYYGRFGSGNYSFKTPLGVFSVGFLGIFGSSKSDTEESIADQALMEIKRAILAFQVKLYSEIDPLCIMELLE